MTRPDQPIAHLSGATGRQFWRGLDELIDQPEFRAQLAERFPALARHAGDWRRRDILKCLGGAVALAGLDGCERAPDEEALPYMETPEGATPGIARYYATAFEYEGIAQPLIGKTREGRPLKLEGNPQHPASRGASDPITQAALLGLYDPDRSAAPRRLGQPADWALFDTQIAELRQQLDASAGAGFRLLTGPSRSPTLLRQIAALLERWPQARWHAWSPVNDPSGQGQRSPARRLLLEQAHAVIALDADPLGPGPLQTWHATGWGARRRAYQQGDGAAQLLVAEPTPTLTGVTAGEERLIAREDRMEALLQALAARLGLAADAPPLAPAEQAWVTKAAQALADQRGRGLVLVGEHHPPALHALAQQIDMALGNLGRTSQAVPRVRAQSAGSLRDLTTAMAAGEVQTLFVLEGNPLYAAPPHLGFANLFVRVPLRIHAGLHANETGVASHWHLPLTHSLESWTDGEAADGSILLTQPLVRPWTSVRSRHALLAGLLDDPTTDRELVRATWSLDGPQWAAALVQGWIDTPTSVAAPAVAPPQPAPPPAPPRQPGLSLLVRPDPSVWDGSFASNPWLQETPKPLTKITWGNAVHISPALAADRHLANGDLVRLAAGGNSITGPVWIVPGQERDTVLLHLGHGRSAGSRVAEGVGFSATPLLGLPAGAEVRLTRIEGHEAVVTTQHHFEMKPDEFVRFVDTAGEALPPEKPKPSFYPPQHSKPAWGMAIDLDLCIGCNACVVACVAENNIPMVGKEQVAKGREMHWLRVDRYYQGSPGEPEHSFQPVPCMHCENAPCEMGCPVNAAVHSDDGLNLQVYNRCIGTRTCSAYCPYKVRRFNWFDYTGDDPPELKAARNPEVTVRQRGVMEKCTYCIQRISDARIAAKKEGRPIADGEVVTACQAACPTQAIVFGDVSEEDTQVSRKKASGRDYDLLAEANTRPRTTYQARIRKGAREA